MRTTSQVRCTPACHSQLNVQAQSTLDRVHLVPLLFPLTPCCLDPFFVLQDLLYAFPNERVIQVDNLFTLGQVVDCLVQISNTRSRRTVFDMKRKKHAAASSYSPVQDVSPAESVPKGLVTPTTTAPDPHTPSVFTPAGALSVPVAATTSSPGGCAGSLQVLQVSNSSRRATGESVAWLVEPSDNDRHPDDPFASFANLPGRLSTGQGHGSSPGVGNPPSSAALLTQPATMLTQPRAVEMVSTGSTLLGFRFPSSSQQPDLMALGVGSRSTDQRVSTDTQMGTGSKNRMSCGGGLGGQMAPGSGLPPVGRSDLQRAQQGW